MALQLFGTVNADVTWSRHGELDPPAPGIEDANLNSPFNRDPLPDFA
jgi:hypothetical protein